MRDSESSLSAGRPGPHAAGASRSGGSGKLPARSHGGRFTTTIQVIVAVTIVGSLAGFFIFQGARRGHDREEPNGRASPPVIPALEVVGTRSIRIDPHSSLGTKLDSEVARVRQISTAALRVTGTVAASLRPIGPDSKDQWQFNDPEALSAFHDWRRALIDVQFSEEQVGRMRELNEIRVASRRTAIERLRRLVAAGTDSLADLQLAEAELLEVEIEGRKDIHEAESDLRRAVQESAVAARQLQMMGLDVAMLEQASADVDIVVAEVPEEHQGRVRLGQQCEAIFLGFPGQVFPGTVQRIAPTLSLQRRALRVLFFVDDPDDQLRPGMFADIGLGTDPRDAILIPAAGVIHIGRDSYVFARSEAELNTWTLTRVQVGDTQNGMTELLAGIEPGTEIISHGAILLKPVAASSLREVAGGRR